MNAVTASFHILKALTKAGSGSRVKLSPRSSLGKLPPARSLNSKWSTRCPLSLLHIGCLLELSVNLLKTTCPHTMLKTLLLWCLQGASISPRLEVQSEMCVWVSLKVLHPSRDQFKPPGPPVTLDDTKLHHLQGRGDDVDSAESGRPVLTFSGKQFFSLFVSLQLHKEVLGLLWVFCFFFLLLISFCSSQIAFLHLPSESAD